MPFTLHHDLVAAGEPAAWMLVCHGIFGSGQNWRTFARKLTERRPEWGAVLVDLRKHGRSQGAPPPHTLESAARDLEALAAALGAGGKPVRAVCGHSFGGKVALQYLELAGPALSQTWVLDASPSARPRAMEEDGVVVSVLRALEALPASWESREAFVSEMTGRGFPEGVARWLAMNLEPAGGGRYESRLDLPALRDLLADYYARDLWSAVEGPGEVHVVAAGRSPAVSEADRARLRRACHLHEIPESGHWLHIEALPTLLQLMGDRLPPPGV